MAEDEGAEIARDDVDVVVPQPADATVDDEVLVVETSLAPTAAGAKQAQVIRRILPAMPDPAPEEDGALAEQVAVVGAVLPRQRRPDLVDQLRREPLIGIQAQRPRGGDPQVVERPVALYGVVLERVLDHLATGRARDLQGTVGAARIDHEDLGIQPLQAAQGVGQVGLLVQRQDDDREHRGASSAGHDAGRRRTAAEHPFVDSRHLPADRRPSEAVAHERSASRAHLPALGVGHREQLAQARGEAGVIAYRAAAPRRRRTPREGCRPRSSAPAGRTTMPRAPRAAGPR